MIEQAIPTDELVQAVEADQFELYFQPIVNTTNRRIRGYEALLRWNHPTRGVLLPASFLPAIKSAGLTETVGNWTIHAAARAVADFRSARCPISIWINVFSSQLVGSTLIHTLRSAAAATDVDVQALAIEVSEDTIPDDIRAAASLFAGLRASGITVAIDDFGTGYSNLGRLRELDVDFVKIDQSLVAGIDHDPRARRLLAAVMDLAGALGVHALAEGVETIEQLNVLASLNCRFVQGFHIGRPQELASVLATQRTQPRQTDRRR